MINAYRSDPYDAWRRFVLGEDQGGPRPDFLDVGAAVGIHLLEPHLIDEIVVVDVKGRGTKKFEAESAGADVSITREEKGLVETLVEMIRKPSTPAAQAANDLFARPGYAEYAHRWTCPVTGLPLKLKLDYKLCDSPGFVELKTSREVLEPRRMRRKFRDFGYHVQAAHNLTGIADLLGVEVTGEEQAAALLKIEFAVVWIETRLARGAVKEGRHKVAVTTISEETLRYGLRDLFEARKRIADALDADEPRDHPWVHWWEAADEPIEL